jgi:hypothetical protein
MAVNADEFLRRFLLHLSRRGFMGIRYFGILANRCGAPLIARCRQLLAEAPRRQSRAAVSVAKPTVWVCPDCGGARLSPNGLEPSKSACDPTIEALLSILR